MNLKPTLYLLFLISFTFCQNTIALAGKKDKTASEFTYITLEGKIIHSSELKGKIILMDFWDTRCSPCIKLMPHMEQLYQKYEFNDDVVVLIANAGWETIDRAKKFANKKAYNLPIVYFPKKESKKLKVREIPKTIVIDQDFKIRYQHVGYDGYNPDKDKEPVDQLYKLIDRLLIEKRIN